MYPKKNKKQTWFINNRCLPLVCLCVCRAGSCKDEHGWEFAWSEVPTNWRTGQRHPPLSQHAKAAWKKRWEVETFESALIGPLLLIWSVIILHAQPQMVYYAGFWQKTDYTEKVWHDYNRNALVLPAYCNKSKVLFLILCTSGCGSAFDCSDFVGILLQMPMNNFQFAPQTLCCAAYKAQWSFSSPPIGPWL